VAEYE